MEVRIPNIDFSQVPAIWAPANPAFGHKYDGASLLLPYLEPYLIKVMRKAQIELTSRGLSTPALEQQIQLFIQQEAQHYQLHNRYNDYLKSHYDGLETFEEEIKVDFERMFADESLAFNLAYSVGFESIGPVQTPLWFTIARSALVNADPAVDELWSWHLAEEFEHRSVAFDIYQLLVGSWRQRIKLFGYQTRHLESFTTRVMMHMMKEDDRKGRFPFSEAKAIGLRFNRRFQRAAMMNIIKVAMPWHNPAHSQASPASVAVLAKYSEAQH